MSYKIFYIQFIALVLKYFLIKTTVFILIEDISNNSLDITQYIHSVLYLRPLEKG